MKQLLTYQLLGILCMILYLLSDWLFDNDIFKKYLFFIIGILVLVIGPWIVR